MLPFKIGNWEINHLGIEWKGETGRPLLIDKDRITETGFGDREDTYDWLVHLTEKNWLTREDIYALNSAFIYILTYYKMDMNSNSFIKTFIEQEKELLFVESNDEDSDGLAL